MSWRDNYFFGKYKEGCSHYFVLKEDNSGWDIIPRGSEKWNSIDQQCWKGHDIDESFGEGCSQKYAPDWLPPIPSLEEVKAVKSVSWEDNFKGKGKYSADDMPNLAKSFTELEITKRTLYFALVEDDYESSFGDGVFRYLKKVSLFRDEIVDYISYIKSTVGNSYGSTGYLREHTIAFDGKYFTMPDFKPGTFEHYKQDDLMKVAEELADRNAIRYFKPKKSSRYGPPYAFYEGRLYKRLTDPEKESYYYWSLSDDDVVDSYDFFCYTKHEYEKINYGIKFEL